MDNKYARNATINRICQQADSCEQELVEGVYFDKSGRGFYDVAHGSLDPFPPPFYLGYLNQHNVQKELGVPLNFTEFSSAVGDTFNGTGDYVFADAVESLEYLLDAGVKVAMVYGDRDYACQWLGGEQLSVALNFSISKTFTKAGYAPLIVNDTYIGGMTRQGGNLSFTRVFQSGHEVPAYQPEAAYSIFARSSTGKDISTGTINAENSKYQSRGTPTSFQIKNPIPPMPLPTCYARSLRESCTKAHIKAIVNGQAILENNILVGYINGTREPLHDIETGGEGNYTGPACYE